MRQIFLSALTAIILAGTPQAATVTVETTTTGGPVESATGGILNIQTITEITTVTGITQVDVQGVGVFDFPDLLAAPSLSETGTAIAAAFAGLGVSAGALTSSALLSFLGSFPEASVLSRDVTTTGPTTFIPDPSGDPTRVTVITGQVNVIDTITQTIENRHLLTVTLAPTSGPSPTPTPSPTPIPLPATAPLLLIGLGGLVALRRTSRGAK